jgi:Chaperone for flagella basal body P-ring formation
MQKIRDRLLQCPVLLAMLLLTPMLVAQSKSSTRYPISEAMVALAMQTKGLDVKPSEVHLPMILSAAGESPQLEIASAERLDDGRLRVQLRCRNATECLPFNATLDVPAGAISQEVGVLKALSGAPISASARALHATGVDQTRLLNAEAHSAATALRVGSHVTLVLTGGHMQINLPAIAMDSAAPGTDVRVCTPDRKQTFHGTVVDATTVKGLVE